MSSNRMSASLLRVTVVSPEGRITQQQSFAPPETVSIGRSQESDVILDAFGTRISRCHAVVLFSENQWEYYNLGVNGSYRNGQKIDSIPLQGSLLIRLGKRGPIVQFRCGIDSGEDSESSMLPDDDITGWIAQIKNGDEEAAQQLWDRYSEQIIEVARRTMKNSSRRVHDEEDVAVVAFRSLLAGITSGRFQALDRRDQLWRLLMVITTRKAAGLIERDMRQKRGGGQVRGDSAILAAERDESAVDGFDQLMSENPTPDIAVVMADETQKLLSSLRDEVSRKVAILKMEGYTHEEIASQIGVNPRTVERRVKAIRDQWQGMLDGSDSEFVLND